MPIADTVNGWFAERLQGGPLARDTEAYNQVVSALPDLIARLTPAPSAPSPTSDASTADSGTVADNSGKASAKA